MPNAFAHVELNTQDLKKAKKFYQSLFDWKLSEAPGGMPYTMINVGTGTGGGMGALQDPGAPSAWLPYVAVDDVKKTLAKAVKGGATIKLDYMPIGEEMGAIAVFADPSGAVLGLWEPGKGATPPPAEPVAESAPKKAPSKAPAAPAKKAAAKKAPAAPAKKAAAKQAPAAPVKKAAAKKAPAAPAKKAGKKKG